MPHDVEPSPPDDFGRGMRRVGRVNTRGKLDEVATSYHPGDGGPRHLVAEDQLVVIHGKALLVRTHLYLEYRRSNIFVYRIAASVKWWPD
jgi:hypothetical protein